LLAVEKSILFVREYYEKLGKNMFVLDARPSAEEQQVYDRVALTLSFAPGILTELQSYKGAGEEIRIVSINNLLCDVLIVIKVVYFSSKRHNAECNVIKL